MVLETGYWNVDTDMKVRFAHRYFVANHRFNHGKVELIFVKNDGSLSGDKELCEFIRTNVLENENANVRK